MRFDYRAGDAFRACLHYALTRQAMVFCLSGLLSCAAAQTRQSSQTNVQFLIDQGGAAMQRGDLAGAHAAFDKAIAVAPGQAPAHFGLGLVELREGSGDAAVASLKRAFALDPKLNGVSLFLGIAQYQTGAGIEAAASLRNAIAIDPRNTEALTWLGIVEIGLDHPEQAAEPLDRAAALSHPDAHVLYYDARAHRLTAEKVYQRLYQLDPDSVLVHRALAESLAASGQPENASAEYEKALRKEPNNAELYEALGEQEQKLSRFTEAEKTYKQELALSPGNPVANYNLGKIAVEHGRPDEGVRLLQAALAAHATPAPANFYLGLGLSELGQTNEAATALERALANQPSPFIEQSAYFQLVRVYERLHRKEDADRALATLKRLKAQNAAALPESNTLAAPAGSSPTAIPQGVDQP